MAAKAQADIALVTGTGGRLGRLLLRARARDGTGAARLIFQSRGTGADFRWSPGDPLSRLPECGTVIALWGQTGNDPAALTDNVALTEESRAVAAACGAVRVIHLSTAGVYGPGRALTEASPPQPTSEYGTSKLAMEWAVAAMQGQDGIAHCCLRLANIVGADSLTAALTGARPARLDRFGDGGGPVRSYLAASDLLRVFTGLMRLDPAGLPPVMNAAAPAPIEMEALLRAAGRDIVWTPAPPTAVHEVTLDVTRLTRLLPGTGFLTQPAEMIADWQALEAAG